MVILLRNFLQPGPRLAASSFWNATLEGELQLIPVPAAELGSVAAKVLMTRIMRTVGNGTEKVLLPTQLILRESTCHSPALQAER